MLKPVNKEEFWKERIESAKQEWHSVYITPQHDWKRLNRDHTKILDELVSGNVLDAGCGYGRWSEHFDQYTGVDFSPDFIKKAKELYPDKTFIQADLKELPFKENEFDWAFCVSIKHMIVSNLGQAEWDKMEKEIKRVAKKLLILEYTTSYEYEVL